GRYVTGSGGSGRIHYHYEVMPGGNCERVARVVDRGPQSANTTVAKVVRAEHGRIVRLIISNAFNVSRPVQARVDRHGVATSPAACVSKGEGLVVVRSGET